MKHPALSKAYKNKESFASKTIHHDNEMGGISTV